METIVIKPVNGEQVKLIQAFLNEHNIKSRMLSDEDKEDIVLSRLMEETNYEETIDMQSFLDKLRSE